MKAKIAAYANYLAAAILMFMGVIYLMKSSFLSYHSVALSQGWNEIDSKVQILILALMRGVSGGLLAASVTIMFLQYKFLSTKLKWIPGLILLIGMILFFTILYAMLLVKLKTPGNPPIALTVTGAILITTAFVLNMNELHK